MSTPSVSVIVTCRDLGRFLPEALASVYRQTYQDFEVVVVDDGSTEARTREVLAAINEPRTRVMRTESVGLSGARNAGIRSTTSPFVTSLDADDRFAPTLLERSMEAFAATPDLGFVSHWLRTFGDETWEWTPEQCDLAALLHANTVNGAAVVRRACFDAVGGFDEAMRDGCEDWDFWISVVEAGFAGTIVPAFLYEYRRRPDSMSRLMMEGEGHARLYAYLARKHAASFRQHLPELLARRERDIAHFRRHIHDLEREYVTWLRPTLASLEDDVAMLTRKSSARAANTEALRERDLLAGRAEEAEATSRELERRVGDLESALTSLKSAHSETSTALTATAERASDLDRAFQDARAIALARDADFHRADSEIHDLRRSWSWRLTAPLRSIAGWLGRRP